MNDELDFTTLSVKACTRRFDEKIGLLIDSLINSTNPVMDNIYRGKILAFKEAKEILLNKKQ